MTRLPYGTYKLLTPEQQLAHDKELRRRFRENHREELNARNARYMKMWMKTKPFVVQCKYCGNDFNAPRSNRCVCPDCHQKIHQRAQENKQKIIDRREKKQELEQKVLALVAQCVLQKYIAEELGISQRTVSNICLRNGMRKIRRHKRG